MRKVKDLDNRVAEIRQAPQQDSQHSMSNMN